MASLLDYDFDLDKMLGTTVNPVNGLINDPNFNTEKNIASGLGVAQALISGYGKQYAPEILLRGLINAKSGRQGVIDKQVKGYMTQQDMFTQTLKNRKLNQDIRLNEYAEADAPLKSEKLEYETGIKKTEYRLGSIREKAILSKMKKLQVDGDVELLEQYLNDPKAFDADQRKSDPRFREISKLSVAEENVMKSLGMDLKNPNMHTNAQKDAFTAIVNNPSPETVASHNASEKKQQFEDSSYVPNILPTVGELIQKYKNNKQGSFNNSQPSVANSNTSPYRSPTFAPEEGYPSVTVNGKEIGGYIDYWGDKYTPKQWESKGVQFQKADSPRGTRNIVFSKNTAAEKNGNDSGNAAQYMMSTVARSNKVIRELMANPEAIKDMKSGWGSLMVNLKAGKYGLQTDAQDASNLLKLIQNKEFIKQIQEMRNNNSTGGAVGNVSDKEVAMFIAAAAALQDTSSATALYDQMLKLHRIGEDMSTKQSNKYKVAFGDEYYGNYNLGSYLDESGIGHVFLPTFKQALEQQRMERVNMDMSLGGNIPIKSNIKFNNPESESVMNQLLGIK